MNTNTDIKVIEEDSTEMVPVYKETPIVEIEQSPAKLKEMISKMNDIYRNVMTKDTHYGTIPGTNKPTLYKSGAEVLCLTFNLGSRMIIVQQIEDIDKPYFDYTLKCVLYSRKFGGEVGEGYGSCNTEETRYAVRKGRKSSRDELFTLKNTILKMAEKRAFVNAVLRVTNASAIFTQDIEDMKGIIGDDLDDDDADYTPKQTQPTKPVTMDTTKKIPNYVPFKSKTETKVDTTQTYTPFKEEPKINTAPTQPINPTKQDSAATIIDDGVIIETPSTPNEGMLYQFQWSVDDEESQTPIPITGIDAGKYGFFKNVMTKLGEKGIMFQEVIQDKKLVGLYCNEIDEKHQKQVESNLQWVITKTFQSLKEETPVDMVPLS